MVRRIGVVLVPLPEKNATPTKRDENMMGKLQNLLLISADEEFHQTLLGLLDQNSGGHFSVVRVESLEKAIEVLNKDNFSLVVFDQPQEIIYADVADHVREIFGRLPIVLLSSSGHEQAINAIRKGIQQVLDKTHINNEMLLVAIISAIERQQMENELQIRDAILKVVNDAAEVFLKQPDWDAHIDDILSQLGQATESDRVYIYQNFQNSDGELMSHIYYEWSTPDLSLYGEQESSREINYLRRGFGKWIDRLKCGETIDVDFFQQFKHQHPEIKKTPIKSLIVVPIFSSSQWWGVIGFEHHQQVRQWSSAEMDAVKTSASMIGAAISRQFAEEELKYLATHDPLTSLPNRLLFADRFEQAISRAIRSGEKVAVICLDLDKFKNVNDTFGHPVGDKALIEVANRLSSSLRGSDTCARIGGDEFGIIADNIKNELDAIKVMEKLSQSLVEEFDLDSRRITISASMGASLYPDHGTEMEALMSAADKALYQVKNTHIIHKVFQKDEQYSWLKE